MTTTQSLERTISRPGILYAITQGGDLQFFRDLGRDGSTNWANGGSPQRIAQGWDAFRQVISGGDGILYAITQGGDLQFFRDLGRDGSTNWANGGSPQRIAQGWDAFRQVISGG